MKEKQVDVIDKEWLAQPFIKSDLCSLEGFVINNKVNYIGLSMRSRVGCTESQNIFPAESEVSTETYVLLTKALEKLVERSNYNKGYFHCEFLVHNKKIYLIDANFGRVGGGCIALQIAASIGRNVEEVYAHVLAVTFLLTDKVDETLYTRNKIKTLSILYGIDQEAKFIDLLRKKPYGKTQHIQLVRQGAILQPVGVNNRSWIGILIGEPDIVLEEIKFILIETNKGTLKPVF
ncbi:hypothetical protein IB642_01350 [Allofrancisella guangzhouensis]|uniref:ATP-grasp domain-containing protein n=1 Tax=Allofrancisella guangzhouensis TaxID=594679 RepID=A0A0A8E550_9GAMM|nr:hypothetical protein [Allofrancisella guangzhouensis]AJC48732.1 hypothetical protein SD28_03280 [Allofrancisella guangzhouensis]MBK2027389.1 hypothetical protein [Allofrancisella guangzhouensis]MBK2043665.1 hypothetical protein [Allofrancisella guangzhouensis]MBK2045195.1 hypothetical protein [Allofrancisella guangzhouensis]